MKNIVGFAALALALSAGLIANAENDRPYAEAEINKIECHKQEQRYIDSSAVVAADEAIITDKQEQLRDPGHSQLTVAQLQSQLDSLILKYRSDLDEQNSAQDASRTACSPQD